MRGPMPSPALRPFCGPQKALRDVLLPWEEDAVARGVEAGIVGFDDKGRPRLIKDT